MSRKFTLALTLILVTSCGAWVTKEALKAKEMVDTLGNRLHDEIKELKETIEKVKQNISEIVEKLVIVKKVQVLLGELSNQQVPGLMCEHRYIVPDFHYKQVILIETKSALPSHYTASIKVNHKFLVDKKMALSDGEDLRVFYRPDKKSLPHEIDRVVTGLNTGNTTVNFMIQKKIPENTMDGSSYALVFGGRNDGKAKGNPKNVFAFFEDFSNSTLEDWKQVWGEWLVKNGMVFGKTGKSPFGGAEVGLFLKNGIDWRNVEVELDLMETGRDVVYPGPFLRVLDPSPQHTTGWWFEYWTDHKECSMRPFINNENSGSKYACTIPQTFVKNKWFHFKYRVLGNHVMQWADKTLIQNTTVNRDWMIPKGTIGLGCHSVYSKSPYGCKTFYDNIKVRLLVSSGPTIMTGDRCQLAQKISIKLPLGEKEHPADSCKQIHDSNLNDQKKTTAKSGVYWIKTSLKSNEAVQTFCDMGSGGWTLVGKVSGTVGNIFTKWLIQNHNPDQLKTPLASGKTEYSCLDARVLAVKYASTVMLSSGDNAEGIGSKWVQWGLPPGREVKSWWNHGMGQSAVQSSGTTQVTVKAWNGNSKVCYQNKFGIMPLSQHGGSYPYASSNKQGNTVTNDYCMAVGVQRAGTSADGWTQNANGYDSPRSDSDWPNQQYNHQSPHVLVWLK